MLFILLIGLNNSLLASDLGKATYEITCQSCHAPQFAIGMHAPALIYQSNLLLVFLR